MKKIGRRRARLEVGLPRGRMRGETGMTESDEITPGLRERLSTAGEEALGEITQALLENPLFNQVLATTLGAGEKAMSAQRSAMSALNIPSASDVERLERRLRSFSNRLEEVEDRLDEVAAERAAESRAAARSGT
jgi:hypothetical protein